MKFEQFFNFSPKTTEHEYEGLCGVRNGEMIRHYEEIVGIMACGIEEDKL